ncbi:MAG: hypothetical protein ACYCZK_01860 [Microbacteriaceae bacterium]
MTSLLAIRRTLSQLRGWPRLRWAVVVGVTAVALAGLAAATGMLSGPLGAASVGGLTWWGYPLVLSGAVLASLVVASYVGAPIGAEATVCDTRWPVLGLGGVALSAAAPSSPAFLSTVFSANADSLAGLAQPAVGLAALALLSWALAQRLGQERKATTPAEPGTDQLDGSACTTCRPLFPSRGVGASGVGASEPSSEVDPRRP